MLIKEVHEKKMKGFSHLHELKNKKISALSVVNIVSFDIYTRTSAIKKMKNTLKIFTIITISFTKPSNREDIIKN